jgi:hypothetical protein
VALIASYQTARAIVQIGAIGSEGVNWLEEIDDFSTNIGANHRREPSL